MKMQNASSSAFCEEQNIHSSLTDQFLSPTLPSDPRAVLPEPHYETVTTSFARWSQQQPEQPAIVVGERIWSYRQLDRRARELARTLRSLGLKPGDAIAVSGERCFGLIAAMMGVLMSRGVLVSVDPNLPSQRQQQMMHAAQTKYQIWVSIDLPDISQNREVQASIVVDGCTGQIHKPTFDFSWDFSEESDGIAGPEPEDAAYIFFTSGSTGTPKSVLGSHKGLSHFLHWQRTTFEVTPRDRCAQLSALSFDVMLRDIFLPLTSGATLHLPATANRLDPQQILPWLERENITLIHTVPSLVRAWLRDVPSDVTLRSLERIFFAGEPLSDTLVRQWRQQFPEAGEILNLYGPTETTLAKCYYRVPASPNPGVQPIGIPLPETQILILADDDRLCEVGEPGEIVIRTPFCSLGYLNPSPLEQHRFAPNPFRRDPADRIYYTGDRGRYRADGTLEILGRLDSQVKIRGVRIEPGEIEAVLGKHPQIWQAAVIPQEDRLGETRLVAYVVSREEAVPTSELRRFLNQELPEVMIPSVFVWLDALPLNPNGKVDRPTLARQPWQPTGKIMLKMPQTEVESKLVRIWQEVLGVSEVGIQDDFFELGGNSLSAVRAIARVEETFGKVLGVATLFESSTIEQLARYLDGDLGSQTSSGIVPLKTSGSKSPFFFINSMGYAKQLAVCFDVERPLYGVNIFRLGLQGSELTDLRLEDIATRAIEQIQTVRSSGPYLLGAYCADVKFAFEIARQMCERGLEVQMLVSIDGIWHPRSSSFALYWDNVRQFGFNYIKEKFQDKLKEYSIKFNKKFRKIKSDLSEESNRTVEDDRLLATFQKAMAAYQPQPYPGQIHLCLSSEWRLKNSPVLASFSPHKVEVDEIFGYHHLMFEEPQVRVLADKLKTCLDRATVNLSIVRDL